jgi:hypothetical protein
VIEVQRPEAPAQVDGQLAQFTVTIGVSEEVEVTPYCKVFDTSTDRQYVDPFNPESTRKRQIFDMLGVIFEWFAVRKFGGKKSYAVPSRCP